LILSQALTLFTTPVVYLYLDAFGAWLRGDKPEKPSRNAPIPLSAKAGQTAA
jgi:hypothetical protein